jgi:predicted amidohydrolase
MKTALVQFDIAWENKSANLRKAESLISSCPRGVDLIILPEMFNTGFQMNPAPRQDVWNTLLKARAIENQCYVAGVNKTGIDGAGLKYIGESVILGPKGEPIASGARNNEGII